LTGNKAEAHETLQHYVALPSNAQLRTIAALKAHDARLGNERQSSPFECDCHPKHKPRDGKWYPFKGSWANEKGLVRHPNAYWEDHEIPGQLSDCMCDARYIYDLEDAPSKTLT
jgi:hypothetical protein